MEVLNLAELIAARLSRDKEKFKRDFDDSVSVVGVRHCYIDDLLPVEIATKISRVFPQGNQMRLMDSFREKKYTSKSFDNFDPLLKKITYAIQDESVLRLVEDITGISKQIADPTLYAGGLSVMQRGSFLNPHIDNSHEATRNYYRTLNLLYYATPDWQLDNGGNIELWNNTVTKQVTVTSKFNRLVLMETTPSSWHSVSPVVIDGSRCCVSNYYFSPKSPTGEEYFHVTSFNARPNQKVRRIISVLDSKIRQGVRAVIPGGLGRKDIYKGD